MTRWSTLGALVLAAVLVTDCGDSASGPASGDVVSITLASASLTVSVGEEQGLSPVYVSKSGAALHTNAHATITSSNPSVATVDSLGTVQGRALGAVTITFNSGAAHASAVVTVVPHYVDVSPAIHSLAIGANVQLLATARAYDGSVIYAAGTPVWTSQDPAVATVDPVSGIARGVSVGNVALTVSMAGRTSLVQLEVGVASVYDGAWDGQSDCIGCAPTARVPITFDILFGSVRNFKLTLTVTVGTCPATTIAATIPSPANLVNGQFSVSTATPSAQFSGSFVNAGTLSGSHGAIAFGPITCSATATNGIASNSGNVPASSFSATKH